MCLKMLNKKVNLNIAKYDNLQGHDPSFKQDVLPASINRAVRQKNK